MGRFYIKRRQEKSPILNPDSSLVEFNQLVPKNNVEMSNSKWEELFGALEVPVTFLQGPEIVFPICFRCSVPMWSSKIDLTLVHWLVRQLGCLDGRLILVRYPHDRSEYLYVRLPVASRPFVFVLVLCSCATPNPTRPKLLNILPIYLPTSHLHGILSYACPSFTFSHIFFYTPIEPGSKIDRSSLKEHKTEIVELKIVSHKSLYDRCKDNRRHASIGKFEIAIPYRLYSPFYVIVIARCLQV